MNPSIESHSQPITAATVLSRQLTARQEQMRVSETEEIRDHQAEALVAINEFLNSGHKAGHVEMATATGKTYLIAQIAQAAADLGMRTMLLAPTLRIAQQLVGEDGQRGLGKFTDLIETRRTGQRYGKNLAQRNLEQPVVVTTYQSLNNLHAAGLAPSVDLIIADEAHRSLGKMTSQTMEEFSPNAIKIGFTATPAYSDERSLDQLLPEKIFALDIRDSVERGLTPPITSLIYETGQEIELLDPGRSEFTERELARLIDIKARNQAIVQFSKDFVQSGMQGAVACLPGSDLSHARLIDDELNKTEITDKNGQQRAIRAASVGTHRTVEDNDSIIKAYDEGAIDVLTFVYSLEQGWDSERPRFMINASPTTSAVRETQLLGRLLRGEDDVVFVDFLDVAKKQQYTSLHVLGEQTIDVKRRVGGDSPLRAPRNGATVADLLSSDLYDRIQLTNGKLLSDLYFSEAPSETERLQRKWNQVLEDAGLGESLPDLFEVKAGVAAVKTYTAVQKALGRWAFPSEAAEYALDHDLTKLKSYTGVLKQMEVAAALATTKLPLEGVEVYVDEDITPLLVEQRKLYSLIDETLNKLTERESGVIRMRFGLDPGGTKTLDEISTVFGVQRERIRQIESKTIAKLRDSSRSKALSGLIKTNPLPDERRPIPRSSIDGDILGPDIDAFGYEGGSYEEVFLPMVRTKGFDKAVYDMVKTISETVDSEAGLARLIIEQRKTERHLYYGQDVTIYDVDRLAEIEGYIAGVKAYLKYPAKYTNFVKQAEDSIPSTMQHKHIFFAGTFEQFHGFMYDLRAAGKEWIPA